MRRKKVLSTPDKKIKDKKVPGLPDEEKLLTSQALKVFKENNASTLENLNAQIASFAKSPAIEILANQQLLASNTITKTLQGLNIRPVFEDLNKTLKTFTQVSETINQTLLPVKQVSEFSRSYFEVFKSIQTQYLSVGLIVRDAMKPTIEALDLFKNSFNLNFESLKVLEGITFKLPDTVNNKFIESEDLDVNLNELEQVGSSSEYRLSTTTIKRFKFGPIEYDTYQNLELGIKSLHSRMDRMEAVLMQRSDHIEEQLDDLLNYYKSGGSQEVTIGKLEDFKMYSILRINGKEVKLMGSTFQETICKVLFASEKNFHKVWDVITFINAIGENDIEIVKEWQNRLRQVVRHLNENIEDVTQLKNFIICTSRQISINPIYLNKK